jgi:lipid-A-disaccharide synthase
MKPLKIYIIAGEASGDLHGANLIKQLKVENNQLEIRAWGGDLMEAEGAQLVKHYRDLAFMGFIEVIQNLKTIVNNLNFCKQDIIAFNPDLVILIDYPGFNMRISKFLKENKIKNFYYISPQIWAWKQGRVHQIKKTVDAMFVILPFEKDFYKKFNYEVTYVGHPLLDAIENFQSQESNALITDSDKPILAILPGSRKQEISAMLPIMLKAAKKITNHQVIIAGAPSQEESFYKPFLKNNEKIVFGQTYQILNQANVALVTSGTATLETALFEVPQVVCYKGSLISYFIAKALIKVKYISLVNLIADKPLVKELIQKDLTVNNIVKELIPLSQDSKERTQLLAEYKKLKDLLGGGGASKVAAKAMLKELTRIMY